MSGLMQDKTAELASRDQILRRERGKGKEQYFFPVQLTTTITRFGDHIHSVDPYSAESAHIFPLFF